MPPQFQDLLVQADQFPQANLAGLHGSALSFALAQAFQKLKRPILLILETHKQALQMAEEINFFLEDQEQVLIFPPLGILPYYSLSPNPETVAERMRFLHLLGTLKKPFIAALSITALHRKLPPKDIFKDFSEYLVIGEEIDREALLKNLVIAGYQNVPLVEEPGTFSKRGGILDLFSPQVESPVRIEFFGDTIESLRYFDLESQRSAQEIEDLFLIPAREIMFNASALTKASLKFRERANELGLKKEIRETVLDSLKNQIPPPALETLLPLFYSKTFSFFDYLPKNTLLVCSEPEACLSHLSSQQQELENAYQACQSLERSVSVPELFLSPDEVQKKLQATHHWNLRLLGDHQSQFIFSTESHEAITATIRRLPPETMLDPLVEAIKNWKSQSFQVILMASSHAQAARLQDLMQRKGFEIHKSDRFQEALKRPLTSQYGLYLLEGHLNKGFVWESERIVLFTDQEIFGQKQRRQTRKPKAVETFNSFEELNEGDYIVHQDHGVAIYQGLQTLDVTGQAHDFLVLEYINQDKLYLPVYRLNLIHRYSSREGQVPQLDKLGASTWERQKIKVKQALKAMAGELIKLYAERASSQGYAFSPRGELYEEFEATFPFEETPDQMKAIQEINEDMDNPKIMDRLICGDVGFGKTEVAMRAAFRAVLDNRQVAVLVPTTVLSLQHERNFRSRFQKFPASIEMLSRFTATRRRQEILEKIRQGKIDVVIGTHALLGKEVKFKDLGLLIVDEEHRFGVSQKEKIKQLKSNADVLTLTATPIPRTLNMSLSGIRDLSLIATPPVDRMAIQTLVANFNENLIQEAIHRELARGGQVYFIHNRVQTIESMRKRLKAIVPEAQIKVGHGQMPERQLEEVMVSFLNREFNVFLCTAIVESGLDVPSANTMIINRADHFGLAQLYQLRGRIGRSNRRAYAYLLIPDQELITPKARARLAVLQRYSDLGSGFKIASHDLEIRGAGNLLGPEQSGHIAAVGYELYYQLLEETILEVKGESQAQAPEPELQLGLAASIPETYIPETTMRLSLYKRFASLEDEEELEAIAEETQDRFGELPPALHDLILLMRVKILAKKLWLTSVRIETKQVVFSFAQETPIDIAHLTTLIQKEPGRFQWLQAHELVMKFKEGKEKSALDSTLEFLRKAG